MPGIDSDSDLGPRDSVSRVQSEIEPGVAKEATGGAKEAPPIKDSQKADPTMSGSAPVLVPNLDPQMSIADYAVGDITGTVPAKAAEHANALASALAAETSRVWWRMRTAVRP